MKAAISEKYGSPSVLVLEDIEKPSIEDNQVLVKVHATSVNAMDYRMRSGNAPIWPFGKLMMGLRKPKQDILGNEVAGEIVEVGRDVTKFKKGDKIFGFADSSYVEYVVCPENAMITTIPPPLPPSVFIDERVLVPLPPPPPKNIRSCLSKASGPFL